MKKKHDYNHIYELCKNHMHSYVLAEMEDGTQIDGIVTGLDDEYVYFAIPVDQSSPSNFPQHRDANRQFGGYGGYGYQGYGQGYPGYGYSPGYGRPPRRFRRLVLPLAALAALSILPWY